MSSIQDNNYQLQHQTRMEAEKETNEVLNGNTPGHAGNVHGAQKTQAV